MSTPKFEEPIVPFTNDQGKPCLSAHCALCGMEFPKGRNELHHKHSMYQCLVGASMMSELRTYIRGEGGTVTGNALFTYWSNREHDRAQELKPLQVRDDMPVILPQGSLLAATAIRHPDGSWTLRPSS